MFVLVVGTTFTHVLELFFLVLRILVLPLASLHDFHDTLELHNNEPHPIRDCPTYRVWQTLSTGKMAVVHTPMAAMQQNWVGQNSAIYLQKLAGLGKRVCPITKHNA